MTPADARRRRLASRPIEPRRRERAVAFVAEHQPTPRRRSVATPGRALRRPRGVRDRTLERPRDARRPGVRRRSATDRAGHRAGPSASAGRSSRPSSADSANATQGDARARWLFIADRLLRDETLEPRWFAFGLLERTIADEPERSWQLAAPRGPRGDRLDHGRRARPRRRQGHPQRVLPLGGARAARLLAHPLGAPARRLSTIATMPFIDHRRGRQPEVAEHGLGLIAQLIGDAEPDVQKALAWALRSLVMVDVGRGRRRHSASARRRPRRRPTTATARGSIRDALSKLDPPPRPRIRDRLDGIRRRPGAPRDVDAPPPRPSDSAG